MLSLQEFFGSPDLLKPHGSFAVLSAAFVLVLCRVSAVIMTAPGVGESQAPSRVRAGLALATTLILLPVVQEQLLGLCGEAVRMPAMLMKLIATEMLAGIFLGMMGRLLCMSLAISGQIISVFTGMSSVIQTDSQLGASSTAISHMASYLAPIILFSTGLYALPLFALSGSYHLFPPGHVTKIVVSDMSVSITHIIMISFRIAMEISAPYILLGTLWPAMLGVLNRLMPAIQVYSLAIPAQILGGILLLALLSQILTGTWAELVQAHLHMLPGLPQ